MRSVLKACAFVAVASLLAGCRVEVSQSNVGRIVKTVLKTRRSSPSFSMDIQVWKGAGEAHEIVHCIIKKDRANTFSYAVRGGARYWSTPDGCVILGAGGERAEVFSGLPEPTVDELREALRWGASRFIDRHTITAHLFTREGPWKGHRVNITPRHPSPFDTRGEQFLDKRSRGKVLVTEYDEEGKISRRRLARSVRILRRGEFEIPGIPECGVERFAPGRGRATAPAWAREPVPVIEVLGDTRARHAEGLAVYDMSKDGFVFVLFERVASEPLVTSGIAHTADIGGVTVSAWPIGEKFVYRWRDGGVEFSLLGNIPPDVAWEFLVANVGAGRALASRPARSGSPEKAETAR